MAGYFKSNLELGFLLDDDRPSHGSAEGAAHTSLGRTPQERVAKENEGL